MGGIERWRELARASLREPLVHFLFVGFLIFILSAWRGGDVDPASRNITIDEAQVARLSTGWEATWRRPPNEREIDALIREYIKEEVYYREALRLGLDEDDNVIRRRLRSKMEFLAVAQIENARPDEAVLTAWLERYPARFGADTVISFDQIYLGQDNDGRTVAKAIDAGADWTRLGEAISLPKSLENVKKAEVARLFGGDFAKTVVALAADDWQGPLSSGFGVHLVRVRKVASPSKPLLSDVRQAVENDWRTATLKQREASAYQALLDGYTIRIAKP